MVITIDGYAGTGKSTAAARLAQSLGFALLNTGAMYRAVGLLLARHDIDIYADARDVGAINLVVGVAWFDMIGDGILANGEDLTPFLRTEALGKAASKVGTFPEVRARLKAEQRRLAEGRDIVCEGRDQGTAVFPEAPAKFFFTASADVRAARREKELLARNQPTPRAVIRDQILLRDYQDENRSIDPLRPAADAIAIDTSHLTEDDVHQRMLAAVERCRSRG